MGNEIFSPIGFSTYVTNAGIKDASKDISIVYSSERCAVAGVYTLNRFASPAVMISRRQLENGYARALVVTSKNANVATGETGHKDATRIVRHVAHELGITEHEIQIAGTGVIGRRLPVEKILASLENLHSKLVTPGDFQDAATGIMTTDTHAKVASVRIGDCVITGIAKGVGMIEPNMATLLAYFFTDAKISAKDLNTIFKSVIDKTFNCISIDTDTSTSDSAVIFANGKSGRVDTNAFSAGLHELALRLAKMIVSDGEGVTKVIEVEVHKAADYMQAKTVAKSIANSPLVKTAIHGSDPNWGRIAMAIGKCSQYTDIDPQKTAIRIGGISVYPYATEQSNVLLQQYMQQNDSIQISVELNTGSAAARVWGCDLSCEYVKFNSSYTS